MKICYLILAYNDIGNLKRLVNRLNENAVFIIHIDKMGKKVIKEPYANKITQELKSYDVSYTTEQMESIYSRDH
ncbi:hypothetical protein EfmGK923_19420 [Enterococcus faecium]|nr:hypothetical protein EfmGK923_19420 [Enterococcus faecium]